MSSEDPKVPAVGSLVAERNSLDGLSYLALVVNQTTGQKWLEEDPVLEYPPPSDKDHEKFIIVRVLGLRLSEGMPLGKSCLPPREHREIEVVRWAFAQINQARIIAGPDVDSIQKFFHQCRICANLGMTGATFFHDLSILIDHLNGVTKENDEVGSYERKFRKMLADVLPQ